MKYGGWITACTLFLILCIVVIVITATKNGKTRHGSVSKGYASSDEKVHESPITSSLTRLYIPDLDITQEPSLAHLKPTRITTLVISTMNVDRTQSLEPLLNSLTSISWSWLRASRPNDVDKGLDFASRHSDGEDERDTVLACLHSHVRALNKIADGDEDVGLVMEDDVRFHRNADAMIQGASAWLKEVHADFLSASTEPKAYSLDENFANNKSDNAENEESSHRIQEPPHLVAVGFLP